MLPTPYVIAHRGNSALAPENTLAAAAAAVRAGADWIEADVTTSADGVPYVIHDPTVDRTTDGTGAVASLTRRQLDRLDAGAWFGPAHRGQRLPTLDALLELVAVGPADLLLEIKGPQTEAQVARIVGAVRAAGMLHRTIVQSFDDLVLRFVRAADADVRLAILRRRLDPDPVATACALDAAAYNPVWDAVAARPRVIAELHGAGIAIMPHTVDDPARWTTMRILGVDGIITNRPAALAGWCRADRPRAVGADEFAVAAPS